MNKIAKGKVDERPMVCIYENVSTWFNKWQLMVLFVPTDRMLLVVCHFPVLSKSCVNDLGKTHRTHFAEKES